MNEEAVILHEGGSPSSRAREIQVPIYSFDMCYTHFRLSTSDKQLCAGYLNRNIGICRGDSGSPLVCKSGSQHTLAGVVSFGSADNPDSFPAVFTRVQSYVQWINDVIAQNG
ncbi:hypothetical protein RRG08_020616 [Elysia crispata]|uniref:Peptidase S1 domain-containing protein n=1 Tax=Elysia crispata TaxID=231223 RepID=A0AAE0YQZ2_9GAST|nr:hypothetical protein RRG08_020616 [Elysia crispata]